MNLYNEFQKLIPQYPNRVAKVISTSQTSSVVEYPEGVRVSVKGTGTVNGNVFVKDGTILSAGPALTVGTQDV